MAHDIFPNAASVNGANANDTAQPSGQKRQSARLGYGAQGYQSQPLRPAPLAITIGLHAAVIGALVLIPSETYQTITDTVLVTKNIPLEAPPPAKQLLDQAPPLSQIVTPKSNIVLPPTPSPQIPTVLPPILYQPSSPIIGSANGSNGASAAPPPTIAEPVIVEPKIDPRYSKGFQPDYPPARMRIGEEGKVEVRVLVDGNGRVKRLEQISASHPDFWRTTERHAQRHWRFQPGTKDGQPVERWITLTLKFTIQ